MSRIKYEKDLHKKKSATFDQWLNKKMKKINKCINKKIIYQKGHGYCIQEYKSIFFYFISITFLLSTSDLFSRRLTIMSR